MSVDLPSEVPRGTPPSTATEAAPKLSNALTPHDGQGENCGGPAQAEYRHNMRPSEWVNPTCEACYDLVVLGGGPAGIAAARLAARMGRTVALVERDALGGRCLATGGIPAQTLIATGRQLQQLRNGRAFGVTQAPDPAACFTEAMARVRQAQATISRQNSARELSRLGIGVYFGTARFASAASITVEGRSLRFRRALIATGARERGLNMPGSQDAEYLTMAGLLSLEALPKRLLVIGGGPLGTEMAQAWCRLGSEVTLVQDAPQFLPGEERDAAQVLSAALARDGVRIRLNTAATAIRSRGSARVVTLKTYGHSDEIEVDAVLAGIGRQPDAGSLDVDVAGIALNEDGGIAVDDHLLTSNDRVYAAGDVSLRRRFTQVAEASARLAVANAFARPTRRMSREILPWCTYTDPEVAHVGMHVTDAHAQDLHMKTYTVLMHEVDRALIEGARAGFAKIHTELGTDRILGATIVGQGAGDIVNDVTLAMQRGIGLRTLAHVITSFPTRSQAVQLAAQACVASLTEHETRRQRSDAADSRGN